MRRSFRWFLQRFDLLLKLNRKPAGFQQIVDTQQNFGRIKGLGQKVLRAEGKGLLFRLRRYVSRQNKNWQIVFVWNSGTQLRQERIPVNMRHHDIEQNQIGLIEGEAFKYLAWVIGFTKIGVSALLQNAFEQEYVGGLIVHNENPAFPDDFLLYHLGPVTLVSCNGTVLFAPPFGKQRHLLLD